MQRKVSFEDATLHKWSPLDLQALETWVKSREDGGIDELEELRDPNGLAAFISALGGCAVSSLRGKSAHATLQLCWTFLETNGVDVRGSVSSSCCFVYDTMLLGVQLNGIEPKDVLAEDRPALWRLLWQLFIRYEMAAEGFDKEILLDWCKSVRQAVYLSVFFWPQSMSLLLAGHVLVPFCSTIRGFRQRSFQRARDPRTHASHLHANGTAQLGCDLQ